MCQAGVASEGHFHGCVTSRSCLLLHLGLFLAGSWSRGCSVGFALVVSALQVCRWSAVSCSCCRPARL